MKNLLFIAREKVGNGKEVLIALVLILLSILFASKAFAGGDPAPLKCDLIEVDNLDTSNRKILDSQTMNYKDMGSGKMGMDLFLKYKKISAVVYSGNEEIQNGYFNSILIKIDGLARATSMFTVQEVPLSLSAQYRPKFSEDHYSATYVVECIRSI